MPIRKTEKVKQKGKCLIPNPVYAISKSRRTCCLSGEFMKKEMYEQLKKISARLKKDYGAEKGYSLRFLFKRGRKRR